jgi:ribonuclease Z
MNAKFVLLNHFSQRYPKIPTFNESHILSAAVAFDLMSITLKDFFALALLYPGLKAIFQELAKEEEKEDEEGEEGEERGKGKEGASGKKQGGGQQGGKARGGGQQRGRRGGEAVKRKKEGPGPVEEVSPAEKKPRL